MRKINKNDIFLLIAGIFSAAVIIGGIVLFPKPKIKQYRYYSSAVPSSVLMEVLPLAQQIISNVSAGNLESIHHEYVELNYSNYVSTLSFMEYISSNSTNELFASAGEVSNDTFTQSEIYQIYQSVYDRFIMDYRIAVNSFGPIIKWQSAASVYFTNIKDTAPPLLIKADILPDLIIQPYEGTSLVFQYIGIQSNNCGVIAELCFIPVSGRWYPAYISFKPHMYYGHDCAYYTALGDNAYKNGKKLLAFLSYGIAQELGEVSVFSKLNGLDRIEYRREKIAEKYSLPLHSDDATVVNFGRDGHLKLHNCRAVVMDEYSTHLYIRYESSYRERALAEIEGNALYSYIKKSFPEVSELCDVLYLRAHAYNSLNGYIYEESFNL